MKETLHSNNDNPKLIDNSPETMPSKRIKKAIEGKRLYNYNKPRSEAVIAAAIGMTELMTQCTISVNGSNELKRLINIQKMRILRLFIALWAIAMLVSCKNDIEKADALRLENKFEEAAALYKKAADNGNAYAMWRLSKAYDNGDGVEFDENKAFELLQQAAQGGCDEAKCDLAFMYMFDWYGIGKDMEKGKKMLDDMVVTTDNSYVLSRYATLFFYGYDPYEEDREKALAILEKVKDKNNPYYCSIMSDVYFTGTEKISIDENKGIDFLVKGFNGGRRYCAYWLQNIYAFSEGSIKKNIVKQMEWLKKGIESNQTDCMVTMAKIYLSEDSLYQDYRNPQKSIDLLKRAAKHGDGEAYYFLGNLYYKGEYVQKDDKKAFENWGKAVELRNPHGGSNLAFAYINGIGCEKDVEKAIDIYKQAVENGSGFSANELYVYFGTENDEVEKNKDLAKYYLFKAAELGDDMGCYNLGRQYYFGGDLVDQNYSQAFVYVKQAANMGLIDACKMIAFFYEEGIGCDKNPVKAKEYRDKTVVKDDNN